MKPATPLPWALMPDDKRTITNMIGHADPLYHASTRDGYSYEAGSQDAAYIVHACNSYPKLVEALLELTTARGETSIEVLRNHTQTVKAANALLRELGEDK